MNAARRERLLNWIGFSLLAICFVLSLGHIGAHYLAREDAEGRTSIRFAHWQLESGLREAYDRLAAEYMQRHPDVLVEQLPVPEPVYSNWLRTQLVGGTSPELIEINHGETNEMLANYFEPITAQLEKPNPYNSGNDLARVPWRQTFVDGLSRDYNQELLEYYGIPSSMVTIRIYYNRALWRRIFGAEIIPQTYEEMVADCEHIAAYRDANGQRVVPLAGCVSNAPLLVQRLFSSETQRLFYSLARSDELFPTTEELAVDFLGGRWSFNSTPAVRDGLELARGVGQFLPAGFLQLKRDDALFLFSQGRAAMTITGSFDAPSIHSQAPFEVGVFDVPVPTRDDPRYGKNTVGVTSEAGVSTELRFAMIKQSSPAKQAKLVDFLQFLTSRESNTKFCEYSGWLPAVVGVQVPPDVQPFLPRTVGYPAGFTTALAQGDSGGGFGAETIRVQDTNMYRLFEPDGGPAAYAAAVSAPLRTAIVADINTLERTQLEAITRQDTTFAACGELARRNEPGSWREKESELAELQTQEEITIAVRRWKFAKQGIALEK